MRGLTKFENWTANELEKLEKQNLILHKKDKEAALKIKALEDALAETLEVLAVMTKPYN
jgi:hypothetical protein